MMPLAEAQAEAEKTKADAEKGGETGTSDNQKTEVQLEGDTDMLLVEPTDPQETTDTKVV